MAPSCRPPLLFLMSGGGGQHSTSCRPSVVVGQLLPVGIPLLLLLLRDGIGSLLIIGLQDQ